MNIHDDSYNLNFQSQTTLPDYNGNNIYSEYLYTIIDCKIFLE